VVGGRHGERDGEVSKVDELDELDAMDDVYLRGIKTLYTWKTLVPECLRSGSYSDTT
jgi:hypothetical protein